MANWIGVGFLVANAVLIFTNVVSRAFGRSIVGTYELVVLLIVVSASLSLFATTVERGHVTVPFVTRRLTGRAAAVVSGLASLLSAATWAVLVWASMRVLPGKWLRERSELLEVPYLPFRLVWVVALILVTVVFLVHFTEAMREARQRGPD
ncbi:MAG: TRAP transporter small permease [Moorellales bacterium]